VISRLKIMADIDIAERRIPQDGRLSVNTPAARSTCGSPPCPTVWGEKVVMRILDNSTARLDLADLGFAQANYAATRRASPSPTG
jgi:type IV pilus assembly protein PilB